MSIKNAGVIGLGAMGYQMARHMVREGFAVAGYDVSPDAMARAKDAGSNTVAADVGAQTEVVVVMVATDAQVETWLSAPACSRS